MGTGMDWLPATHRFSAPTSAVAAAVAAAAAGAGGAG
jgi:hypothetical protein